MNKRINLHLPTELYEQLRKLAFDNRTSMTELIRHYIEEGLKDAIEVRDVPNQEMYKSQTVIPVVVNDKTNTQETIANSKSLGDCQVHFMDSTPGAEFCESVAEYEWEIPPNWQQIEGVTRINLCEKHYDAMTMEKQVNE